MFDDHLCRVPGVEVGHHTCARRDTGCSVVICRRGAVAGVDVRGGAPGTRETDLLAPEATVEHIHAVLLTGGSAFGLDAATGVMRWLENRRLGVTVGRVVVPVVPAAVLFDLWHGDTQVRPDATAGFAACEASAATAPAQGSVGAGAGASVGKWFGFDRATRSGIGSASVTVDGVTLGALIAVNAVGDVVDPHSGRVLAGARGDDGRFMDTERTLLRGRAAGVSAGGIVAGGATVIGVVATDATLTKAQCRRLATMAHDGLARTIRPSHLPADGDTLFALSTAGVTGAADLTTLGAMAADAVTRAVLRAVQTASTQPFR